MQDLATALIGSHFLFFREGDAFALPAPGGICGPADKPGLTDPNFDEGWIDIGAVESVEPTVNQEEFKLWTPGSAGRLTLKDIPETKQEMSFKIIVNDVSPLSIETQFRASQKLGGAQKQFTPLGARSRRGWGHFQMYGDDDQLWLLMDVWCRLRSTGKFDGTPTKPEYEVYMLHNDLNTGTTA